MGISEALESPITWICGVVGTAMVLLGWKLSNSWDTPAFPFWQVLIIIAVIWIASGFFGSME